MSVPTGKASISVKVGSHLSLKIGLQALFEAEPALEDVDLVARVVLRDPDLIPGSGDEFFETVASGGSELPVGSGDVLKEDIDLIFRTSLVINF